MGTILEEIPYQDLNFEEVVGRGSFGVVYRARWRNQTVAVKRAETETEVQSFMVEVRQLQRVCHPNIITIYGVCLTDSNPLCLVMEYADGGSLYQFLHGVENRLEYSLADAIRWLIQIARGVHYLHSMKPKPLIHRDLKPPNILMTDGGHTCKICDFGTACEAQTYLTNNRGSAAWMAPEVFESNKYTEKCDVFSFAVIIWEVLTRRRPYDDVGGNIYRIMWAIHRGIRPAPISGCPAVLETMMQRCWSKNTTDRPSMSKVVRVLELLQQKLRRRLSTTQRVNVTDLHRSHSYPVAGPSNGSRYNSDTSTTHTSTINILPIVEAEAEPSVRYTTLHEYRRGSLGSGTDADDLYPPRMSNSYSFPVANDDHGFSENNYTTPETPTDVGGMAGRPAFLPLKIQNNPGNFRISYPSGAGNLRIQYSVPRTVQRVQTYTFGVPSPTESGGTTHRIRIVNDADDFATPDDGAVADEEERPFSFRSPYTFFPR